MTPCLAQKNFTPGARARLLPAPCGLEEDPSNTGKTPVDPRYITDDASQRILEMYVHCYVTLGGLKGALKKNARLLLPAAN